MKNKYLEVFKELERLLDYFPSESDDYDYMFVGMSDFINKQIPLKDSVDRGLENLEKLTSASDRIRICFLEMLLEYSDVSKLSLNAMSSANSTTIQ